MFFSRFCHFNKKNNKKSILVSFVCLYNILLSYKRETTLHIANLPDGVDEEALKTMLSPFGEVKATSILQHKHPGKSRVGFCYMATKEECQNAIDILHGSAVDGGKQDTFSDLNYITVH